MQVMHALAGHAETICQTIMEHTRVDMESWVGPSSMSRGRTGRLAYATMVLIMMHAMDFADNKPDMSGMFVQIFVCICGGISCVTAPP